jgi:hypothetical protein
VLRREAGLLQVASVHAFSDVASVQAATGFPLSAGPATPVTPPPTDEERTALATIDPSGVVAAEFQVR